MPENTPELCSDGCSNDGDSYVDCDDFDCCRVRSDCPPTSSCGRRSGPCDGATMPENTPELCSDGCSNDGDPYADCNDFDCCAVVRCPMGTACYGRDAGT
jgi:hypothetical protein